MNSHNHFHTIIIGAGPGGLACATSLAQKGVDVLVLERNRRIGPKVCAGGVTWSGLARHLPEGLIERPFDKQHICSRLQRTIIKAKEPIISTVNRENLGQWMAQKALGAGATILTDTLVTRISGTKVTTRSSTFTYDHLVGADGSNSLVRRFMKIPTEHIGAGVHYQVPGHFPDMVWHLDPDLFSTGYAWIFPHEQSASVGAYANRADLAPKVLQEKLHHWIKKRGINIHGLKAEAATINFDYRGWRFGNTYLVGDAAGLASGLTGEGIYPAVLSGKTVARSILNPETETKDLDRLIKKQQMHSRVLKTCGRHRLIAKIILETLITSLRMKLISFKALEMGD